MFGGPYDGSSLMSHGLSRGSAFPPPPTVDDISLRLFGQLQACKRNPELVLTLCSNLLESNISIMVDGMFGRQQTETFLQFGQRLSGVIDVISTNLLEYKRREKNIDLDKLSLREQITNLEFGISSMEYRRSRELKLRKQLERKPSGITEEQLSDIQYELTFYDANTGTTEEEYQTYKLQLLDLQKKYDSMRSTFEYIDEGYVESMNTEEFKNLLLTCVWCTKGVFYTRLEDLPQAEFEKQKIILYAFICLSLKVGTTNRFGETTLTEPLVALGIITSEETIHMVNSMADIIMTAFVNENVYIPGFEAKLAVARGGKTRKMKKRKHKKPSYNKRKKPRKSSKRY